MMMTVEELMFQGAKYGVVMVRNIYHEGDEYSRTNPGPGYPAYTEKVREFKSFATKEAFEEWAFSYEGRNSKFVPIIYFEMKKKETVEFHL
jgi:hypothetical protein